jgi:Domain of unknown function (DUF4381)
LGWWIVVAFCLLLMAIVLWWWRYSSYAAQRRRRRLALGELQRIRTSGDSVVLAQSIQNLLRRFALVTFGHDRVAHLSGEAWLSFVAAQGGQLLSGDAGRSLLSAAFGGTAAHERRDQWFAAAESFIRSARPVRAQYSPREQRGAMK